jgi:hypothetical protein
VEAEDMVDEEVEEAMEKVEVEEAMEKVEVAEDMVVAKEVDMADKN